MGLKRMGTKTSAAKSVASSVASSKRSSSTKASDAKTKRKASADPTPRLPKRPNSLLAGVMCCARCSGTSEAKKWALMEEKDSATGKRTEPLGDASYDCYSFWQAVYKSEYGDFQSFAQACRSDRKFNEGTEAAQAIHLEGSKPTFDSQEVLSEQSVALQIERRFVVLSESELRTALGASRLGKNVTKGLFSFTAPQEKDASKDEQLYAFAHPEAPYREAKLTISLGNRISGLALDRKDSCYESQGRHVAAQRLATQSFKGLTAAHLKDLPDFLHSQGVKTTARTPSKGQSSREPPLADDLDESGDGSGSDLGATEAPEHPRLVGPAAASATAYTSPGKFRPPVPPFTARRSGSQSAGSGVQRCARVAEVSMADNASAAGSRVSSGDGGGGDDDGDDSGGPTSDEGSEGEEDVVVYWRRRLPLYEVMEGAPKGSVRALRAKVARLAQRPEGRDASNRLRNYLDVVELARLLRRERIMTLPCDELRSIIKAIMKHDVPFPPLVKICILNHKVEELCRREDLGGLLRTMRPWTASDSPFDALEPLLASVGEITTSSRLSRFKGQVWSQALCPLVMSACEDNKQRVLEACGIVIDTLDAEDMMEMETPAATMLQETITSMKSVRVLVSGSVDPSCDEVLRHMRDRKGKTDRTILTSCANAIHANAYLCTAMDLFTKGRPVIMEWGDKILEHEATLDHLRSDSEGLRTLTQVLRDLSKVRSSVVAELFDPFAAKVLDKVNSVWNEIASSCAAGAREPDADLLGALPQFASEATIAFSLNDEMLSLQDSVSGLVATHSGQAMMKNILHDLAKGVMTAPAGEGFADMVADMAKNIDSIVGLPIPEQVSTAFATYLSSLAMAVVCDLGAAPAQELAMGLDLWEKLLGVSTSAATSASMNTLLIVRAILNIQIAGEGMAAPVSNEGDLDEASAGNLSVLAARATMAFDNFKDAADSDLVLKVKEIALAVIHRVGTRIMAFGLAEQSRKRTALATATLECANLCAGVDEKWFSGIRGTSDAAWAKVQTAAETSIKTLRTKELEVAVASLMSAKAFDDSVGKSESPSADDLALHAQAALDVTKFHVFLRQALLLWHLTSDIARDEARKRCQAEIKSLRSAGLDDKKVLPDAMHKRAWDLIACRL